jgi:hypothetical protein
MTDQVFSQIDEVVANFNLSGLIENYKINNNIIDKNPAINNNSRSILKKDGGIRLPQDRIQNGINIDFKLNMCKKMLLDKMTEMIAREVCFRDSNQVYIARFQYLVNNLFEKGISEIKKIFNIPGGEEFIGEKDIIFLYKGGTTMKILFRKYHDVIGRVNNMNDFFEQTQNNFQRSDSDYSIYINPNLATKYSEEFFNMVYITVNQMAYIVLDKIREFINSHPDQIVPFYELKNNTVILNKINDLNQVIEDVRANPQNYPHCSNLRVIEKIIGLGVFDKKYMVEEIPDLNESNIDFLFSGETDSMIENKHRNFIANKSIEAIKGDFIMTYNKDDTNAEYKSYVPLKNKDFIYLSANETNEFSNLGTTAAFMLQRLKVNFVCYYKTIKGQYGFFSCPSELVDVSILKRNASGLPLFFEHIDKEYKQFSYIFRNKEVKFKGYTIYGHINDLLFVLFDVVTYPWDDTKYEKRLKRVIVLLFLELCINYNEQEHGINQIVGDFNEIFSLGSTLENIDQKNNLLNIANSIYENYQKNNKGYTKFILKLVNIIRILDENNFGKFNKMCNVALEILNLIPKFYNSVVITEGTFNNDVERVYQLGGNYKEKYLKYKKKYFELKNK